MAMPGIERREQIVRVMRERIVATGDTPTLDEIGTAVGLRKSTVRHHLQRLVEEGVVEQVGRRRSYRPLT
jgi:DNA-binding IclR family transcriptional regulator